MLTAIKGGLIPQAYGFNFYSHQICKGWNQQDASIPADKINICETVYLHFDISWANEGEYEQTWGNTLYGGLSSAEKITESSTLKTFKISLVDPDEAEVNTFTTRTMHQVECEPPGCISTAFLEIINITSTTKNGKWKLKWYNGSTLLFTEEFVVREEQAGPADSVKGSKHL